MPPSTDSPPTRRPGVTRSARARPGAGLFAGSQQAGAPPLCAPLELDEFVAFVNGLGPQEVKRISKHDVEFEKQLVRKKP